MAEDTKPQIPYVPYNTFSNSLAALTGTLPPRLDKSMWPSYSGAIQGQLWSAYKFFQLVKADGSPAEVLVTYLNSDAEGRKALLEGWLREYYPELMKLDLAKATVGHFSEAMRGYGLGAETQKKATSFFLQAAKAAGIELSSFILKTSRTPAARKAKKGGAAKQKAVVPPLAPLAPLIPGTPASGPARSINLANGITLSLSTSADTFRMTPEDRKFVNGLLEALEQYEADHALEDDTEDEDEA